MQTALLIGGIVLLVIGIILAIVGFVYMGKDRGQAGYTDPTTKTKRSTAVTTKTSEQKTNQNIYLGTLIPGILLLVIGILLAILGAVMGGKKKVDAVPIQ